MQPLSPQASFKATSCTSQNSASPSPSSQSTGRPYIPHAPLPASESQTHQVSLQTVNPSNRKILRPHHHEIPISFPPSTSSPSALQFPSSIPSPQPIPLPNPRIGNGRQQGRWNTAPREPQPHPYPRSLPTPPRQMTLRGTCYPSVPSAEPEPNPGVGSGARTAGPPPGRGRASAPR